MRCQAGDVERRAALAAAVVWPLAAAGMVRPDTDGDGRAADDEIRMRVLAAENGVQRHHVALPGQCIEVVRHGHEVGFRRQLVGGVPPVAVAEEAELAAVHLLLQLGLHVGEIARRGSGVLRQRLRQRRGRLRVGLQRGDDIHPVQCMQMVEMHDVVVDVLCADHQVADQLGVGRDADLQRVLDGADRGDGMHQGAHAADALGEGPGVARIASAQDDLDAAHHGAGRVGLLDGAILHLRLDAQVAFDAGDGIDDDALVHGVTAPRPGARRPVRSGPESRHSCDSARAPLP